jgi:hypothetical protein
MFRYFVIAVIIATVLRGSVAWFNGVRHLRDSKGAPPNTPREIWYVSIRGPYTLLSGLLAGGLLAAGVAEFMCLLALAVLLFPESLFWNLDHYTQPIKLKRKKSENLRYTF